MKATAKDLASLTLDERGLCDLELLSVGGFSPLAEFLGKADYERVVGEMRLADGTLWPLPVTLPVTPGDGVAEGQDRWPCATSTATCWRSSTSRRSTPRQEARGRARLWLARRQASRRWPTSSGSPATMPRAGSR